jgi:hypothetical protein
LRKNNELIHKWGVKELKKTEQQRSAFVGREEKGVFYDGTW